jgi:non-specific serine/threonine protein kinase
MPTGPDDALKRAARAVTDGRRVDWENLSTSFPHLRSRLEQLRLIESLAASTRPPGDPLDAMVPPSPEVAFSWGPLQVMAKIGEGSFGEVYRAFDPVLQREVALKLHRLPGDATRSAFESHIEEARKLARVRHPNVLTVHGIEVHDGRAGMWTDFIRGETLEERITANGPFVVDEIAAVAQDLCRALAAVHTAQIVHGDIKASNAMRERDGRIILMDFGAGSYLHHVAKAAQDAPAGAPESIPPAAAGSRIIGTPLAMAPELLAGAEPNVKSDLYALGVLLFRLATGRHPIEASTPDELLQRHQERRRIPLREIRPDLPEAFVRSIERAISHAPEERYADAIEMGSVLAASLGASPAPMEGAAGEVRNPIRFSTRFIGRERELAAGRKLAVESPLVTFIGPGGTGKTRLAARLAEELAGAFPGGVCFAELANVTREAPLDAELARALGIREEPSRPIRRALVEHLAGPGRLLVLDNCEQVIEEARELCGFIRRECPNVHLIATSRQAFSMPGECVFRTPPLSVPPSPQGRRRDGLEVTESEAVRLFIDRAVRSRPEFSITEANAPHVAAICRRLEGIPLAIELAAARVRALGTEEIASRLEESFRILAGGESGPTHHSTIDASIDWSYRLLREPEQRLFRRLSVFAGPWSIEAAEFVCADDGDPPGLIALESILDLLEDLVEKSLVTFEVPREDRTGDPAGAEAGGSSYRMQEMVRQYAWADALRAGEADGLRSRHLAYYFRKTEEIQLLIYGEDQERHLAWMASQQDNYRAAIRWSMGERGDIDAGLRIASILRRFWFVCGYATEGRRLLHELIGTGRGSTRNRANAITSASVLAWSLGDVTESERLALEALRIHEEAGRPEEQVPALSMLGTIASDEGDYEKARGLLERALALRRKAVNPASLASILCNLGVLCARQGDLPSASRYYEEAYAVMLDQGDLPSAATMLLNFSATARDSGDLPRSRELAFESVRIFRTSQNRRGLAAALVNLAKTHLAQEDLAHAGEFLLEGLASARDMDDRREVVDILEIIGQLWAAEGRFDRAARLLGAAEALRETVRQSIHPLGEADHEAAIGRAREALGMERFAAARAQGRAMSFDRAVAYAIDPTPSEP